MIKAMVIARGAAGGLAASVVMSGFMRAAQAAGWLDRLPPRIIVDEGLDRAGAEETPKPARSVVATLAHLGFGIGCGALYALARSTVGARGHSRLQGTAFGTLVWLSSYAGWIPALDILPPPTEDRPRRQLAMVAAHWVYGAVLGSIA